MASELTTPGHTTGEEITREPRHHEVHFERTDWSTGVTIGILIGTLIGMWIITALLVFYFDYLEHNRTVSTAPPLPIEARGNPLPPEPRLQESPREDLKQMRAREDWTLTHYSWVDKQKGVVAIPIDRAIQIVAQRGIPPQKAPAGLNLSQPQAGTRLTGFEGKVEPEPR